MKKLKKFLLSTLSLALVAVLSVAGTLAYLTSEDSDVNVMTMGNVKIAQHEYERAENEDGSYKTDTIDNQTSYVLKEFTQDKMLLPIVGDPSTGEAGWDDTTVRMTQVDSYGSMQVFAGKVAQDKFVTVENTGKNDAYIRTIVAIEVGSTDASLIGTSYHKTWSKNGIGTISVNDTTYYVIEYTYNGGQLSDGSWRHKGGVLPAGDTSYPSLSQVYLKSETENEDVEAIDGNKNGRLDILVLSQAVQTSGFENSKVALDRAFGETTVENAAKWFDGMTYEKSVSSFSELNDAFNKYPEVIISNDFDTAGEPIVMENTEVVIEGNNNTLTAGSSIGYGYGVWNDSSAVFNDVNTIGGGVNVQNSKVTFNSGLVEINTAQTGQRYVFYVYNSEVVINEGTFKFEEYKKRGYIYAQGSSTVIINGGTFGPASNHPTDPTAPIIEDGGEVIIKGGTFGFNPTTWVATGYTAVDNGNGTWTVQAA